MELKSKREWMEYFNLSYFQAAVVEGCLMASPTIDTFCCVVDSSGVGIDMKLEFRVDVYTIVCITSSIFSIFGAMYQLLPRPKACSPLKRLHFSGARQRRIIAWLAFADLLAALGILVRSAYWLLRVSDEEENNNGGLFCALVSGWIQYFYTATYFWNLSYALDVYFVLQRKNGKPILYHLLSWGLPAITASVGLSILYRPDLKCQHDVPHVLPNYLCTHVPLLFAMIMNPVLYVLSSNQVNELLTKSFGQFSYQERKLARALKQKFFDIVLVFYICWLPNVVNSLLLWTMWHDLYSIRDMIITVWYVMAVLNPLQAVLNSLVYRSWEGFGGVRMLLANLFSCCSASCKPVAQVAVRQSEFRNEPTASGYTPLTVNGHKWYGTTSGEEEERG